MNYYDGDLEKQLVNLIDKPYFKEWLNIVKPILLSDEFQRRKLFKHHDYSVWSHSINVSYNSFITAKRHNLDEYVCAIAGILHDFYPYTYKKNKVLEKLNPNYLYRVNTKAKLNELHTFVHPYEASINALKFYPELVNEKILSCIRTHMFPLTIKPPRYKEGWVITLIDKRDSLDVIKELRYIPSLIKNTIVKNG